MCQFRIIFQNPNNLSKLTYACEKRLSDVFQNNQLGFSIKYANIFIHLFIRICGLLIKILIFTYELFELQACKISYYTFHHIVN